MLRCFTYGERDFRRLPDRSDFRLNWEFWIAFRSKVRPVFHDEAHRQVEAANFWAMPPNLRYHWLVDGGKTERAVLHSNHSSVGAAIFPAPFRPTSCARLVASRTRSPRLHAGATCSVRSCFSVPCSI